MNGWFREHFKMADVIEIALLVFAILAAYFSLEKRLSLTEYRMDQVERCCQNLRRAGG